MVSDQTKTVSGTILLLVSSVLLLAAGVVDLFPLVLAAIATTGLAVGSLLIGTTGEGPAV
jgi:hypothetical protein